MEPIYETEMREVGPEVAEFLETGYLILFQMGAPPELAEMAVLHKVVHMRPEPPEAGDVLAIGESQFRITAVGGKAWKNIEELGHAVFLFNGAQEPEMPGQICLEDTGTENLSQTLRPGTRLEIKTGVAATIR
ncbi:MAG: PTS glucitol/sorbitol transporter subunit IIA [Actinomycetota bacterium]|nr:PTS glucitol/sorbitol transporter subunit IIA [Actinomycetota bacterium]